MRRRRKNRNIIKRWKQLATGNKSKMSIVVLMPERCRCCMFEENDMVYVFDTLDEFDSKISDLISTYGGIEITDDDIYSKNICGNCLNDLANAARFRERCMNTSFILQNTTVNTKGDVRLRTERREQNGTVKVQENFIEEIIVEHVEEMDQDVLKISEIQNTNNSIQSDIQYIYAEEATESELNDLDYENLISEQNDLDENQLDNICFQELDKGLTGSNDTSILKPLIMEEKETRLSQLNFTCQHCGAGFALQKNLARHLVMHKNYVCDTCLIVFESEKDLAVHRLSHSSSSMEPQSDVCIAEKRIKSKKNHRCSYCNKTFVSNSALIAHVRVHTKEKPYPCNYCDKRFRTVGAQELHERRHNGVKPYKCDLCGKGFTESSNLKVHRRTHTQEKPHVCTVCNRAFARVFLLQIHQRTHTGDRPFSCLECGKSFSQQGDLAAHRRIHTGERPHRCDLCGKGFIKSSGLTQHRKKHEHQGEDFQMVGVSTMAASPEVLHTTEEFLIDYDLVTCSKTDSEEKHITNEMMVTS